eukprot:jgi/Mesvir1/27738/Mv07431-RA.3
MSEATLKRWATDNKPPPSSSLQQSESDFYVDGFFSKYGTGSKKALFAHGSTVLAITKQEGGPVLALRISAEDFRVKAEREEGEWNNCIWQYPSGTPAQGLKKNGDKDEPGFLRERESSNPHLMGILEECLAREHFTVFVVTDIKEEEGKHVLGDPNPEGWWNNTNKKYPEQFEQVCRLMREMFYFYLGYTREIPYKHGPLDVTFTFLKVKGKTVIRTDKKLHCEAAAGLSPDDEEERWIVPDAYECLNDRVFRYAARHTVAGGSNPVHWYRLDIRPDTGPQSAARDFGDMTLVLLYFPCRGEELEKKLKWPCRGEEKVDDPELQGGSDWKEIKVYINGRLMPYEFLGLDFILPQEWMKANEAQVRRVRGFLFLGPRNMRVNKTKWTHAQDLQAALSKGAKDKSLDIPRTTSKNIQEWIQGCSKKYDVMVDLYAWESNEDLRRYAFSTMKLRSSDTVYCAGDKVVVMARRGADRNPLKIPATLVGFQKADHAAGSDRPGAPVPEAPAAEGLSTCRVMIRREPRKIFAESIWEVSPADICANEDVAKEMEDWKRRAPHCLCLKVGNLQEEIRCHQETARTAVVVLDGNEKEMSKWEDSAQEPQTLKFTFSVRRRVFLITPRPAGTRNREPEEKELPEFAAVVTPSSGTSYDFKGFVPSMPGEFILRFDLERPELSACLPLQIQVFSSVGEAKDFDVSFHLKPGQDDRLEAYLGTPIQCTATFYDKEGTDGHRNQVASLRAAQKDLRVNCNPPLEARVCGAPYFDEQSKQLRLSIELTRMAWPSVDVTLPFMAQVQVKCIALSQTKTVKLTLLPGFPAELRCPTFEAGNYALENREPVKDIRVEYLDETGSNTQHFPPSTSLTVTITRQTAGHMEESGPADGEPSTEILYCKQWDVTDERGQLEDSKVRELKTEVNFEHEPLQVEAQLEIRLRLGPASSGTTAASAATSGNGRSVADGTATVPAAERPVPAPREVVAVYPIWIMPCKAPSTLRLYRGEKHVVKGQDGFYFRSDVGQTLEGYKLRVFSEGGDELPTADLTLAVEEKSVTGEDLVRFRSSGALPRLTLPNKRGIKTVAYKVKDAAGHFLELFVKGEVRPGEHCKWGIEITPALQTPAHRRKSHGGKAQPAVPTLARDSDIITLPLGVPLANTTGIRIAALDWHNNVVQPARRMQPCIQFSHAPGQQQTAHQQQVKFLVPEEDPDRATGEMDTMEDGPGSPRPPDNMQELPSLPPRYLEPFADNDYFTFAPNVYLVGDASAETHDGYLHIATPSTVKTEEGTVAGAEGPNSSFRVKFTPPKASMGKVTLHVQNLVAGQRINSRATLQGLSAELRLPLPGGRGVVVSSGDAGDAITLVLASRTPGLQLVALRQPESGSRGGGRSHGHGGGASSSTAPSQDMIQGEVLPGGCARYSFPPLGLIWGSPVDAHGTVVRLAMTAQRAGEGTQQAPVALAEEIIDLTIEPDPAVVTGINVLTTPNGPPAENLEIIATDPLPSIMLSLLCEDGEVREVSAEHKPLLTVELTAPGSRAPENGTPRTGAARRSLGATTGTLQATAETEGASSERLVFRFQESEPSLLRKVGTYTLTARWKEASQDASLQPREVVKEIPVTVLPGPCVALVASGWSNDWPYNNQDKRVLGENVRIIAQDSRNNIASTFQATVAVSLHCKDDLQPEQLAALDGNPPWTFQVVKGQGKLPALSLQQDIGTVDAGYELHISVSACPSPGQQSSVPPLLRLPFSFHNMAGLDRHVAECKRVLQGKQQEMRPLESARDLVAEGLDDARLALSQAELAGRRLLGSQKVRQVLPPVPLNISILDQLESALGHINNLLEETRNRRREAMDQVDSRRNRRGVASAGLDTRQRALMQRYQEHLYPLVDLGWVEDDNLANITARALGITMKLVVLKEGTPHNVHEELNNADLHCLKWNYLPEGPMHWTLPHKRRDGHDMFTPQGNPRFLASHFVMPETLPPPLKAAIQKALGKVVILDTRENAEAYLDRLPKSHWGDFSIITSEDMCFWCRSNGISSRFPDRWNGRLAAGPTNPADHPHVRQLNASLLELQECQESLEEALSNVKERAHDVTQKEEDLKEAEARVNHKMPDMRAAERELTLAQNEVRQRQPAAPAAPGTPASGPAGLAAQSLPSPMAVVSRDNPRSSRKRSAAQTHEAGPSGPSQGHMARSTRSKR